MHDPKTVAFEIPNLFAKKRGNYRPSLITIWHVDPEKGGDDDSCGWFVPPATDEQIKAAKKIAREQYGQIFAKQVAEKEDKSYAYICYNQDCYGAIYWSWRALNVANKKGWQYGKQLSTKEIDAIFTLAYNPVDNLQHSHFAIKDEKSFTEFFMCVWRSFRRFQRPWYKHPRWHVHHWQIQFHPWQNLKRRYWDKCSVCGKRGFKGSAYGDWSGTRIWHEECDKNHQKPGISHISELSNN